MPIVYNLQCGFYPTVDSTAQLILPSPIFFIPLLVFLLMGHVCSVFTFWWSFASDHFCFFIQTVVRRFPFLATISTWAGHRPAIIIFSIHPLPPPLLFFPPPFVLHQLLFLSTSHVITFFRFQPTSSLHIIQQQKYPSAGRIPFLLTKRAMFVCLLTSRSSSLDDGLFLWLLCSSLLKQPPPLPVVAPDSRFLCDQRRVVVSGVELV